MPVVLVSYGYSQGVDLSELGPDAVIDSLAQVLEIVESS
jgi:phosphoglycolate phosphatase-like HAD superfamily hydrolase